MVTAVTLVIFYILCCNAIHTFSAVQTANKTCSEYQFKCDNRKCIPREFACDGDVDCDDNSDETPANCESWTCLDYEYQCDSGQCVDLKNVCDKFTHCSDGSDEDLATCVNKPCPDSKFKCHRGHCIPMRFVCDKEVHCTDGRDESIATCANKSCSESEFKCGRGICIPMKFVCDGNNHCADRSDESRATCGNRICTETETKCSSGYCIPKTYLCDGVVHCAEKWDEVFSNCEVLSFPTTAVYIAVGTLLVLLNLCLWIRKYRRTTTVMSFYGLADFEKGNMKRFNPELTLQEQIDLLPYDKKWEFPRGKLKLGRQLGSGAFGVVTEAIAIGIVEKNKTSTVAVKMVKLGADQTSLQNLASELKIMAHLGKHLNVINLLGACTKKLAKLELMVIVEFCPHDNVHKYIQLFKDDFLDQMDSATGELKPALCKDASEILRPAEIRSTNNVHVTILPALLCTEMLLWWAYQIAKGMEYLSSKKILHGDLAARNILLAENSIVKVSDFGLSSSLYKSDYYRKSTSTPLPIKWMSPEAIAERLFSIQSDVWSYGIVLWEMFAHSRIPYPEMEADERLYLKLIRGYRMEKPRFSTNSIYRLMRQCWRDKAIDRPSFTELAKELENVINCKLVEHHKDLNTPYEKMNKQIDYTSKLRRPTYMNRLRRMTTKRVKNQYVENPKPVPLEDGGYLTVISIPSNVPEPQLVESTAMQNIQSEKTAQQFDICLDIHSECDVATHEFQQDTNLDQPNVCLQNKIQDSNNESLMLHQMTTKENSDNCQDHQIENNSSDVREFSQRGSIDETDTDQTDLITLKNALQVFNCESIVDNTNFPQQEETLEGIESEEINTKM